jgi:hypothetical protein
MVSLTVLGISFGVDLPHAASASKDAASEPNLIKEDNLPMNPRILAAPDGPGKRSWWFAKLPV